MIYILQNAVPILVATLAGLAVGGSFYPAATRHIGLVLTAFVAEAWFNSILAGALILAPAKADPWIMAIGTAVVIWIGFVVPAIVVSGRVRSASVAAVTRDALHWLVKMVVVAAILHGIGLVAPQS